MNKILFNTILINCFILACLQGSAQCNPAFSSSTSGSIASFQAANTAPNLFHNWTFGDGTAGYGAQTSHNYSQPGTYIIKHWVRDSFNTCMDSTSAVVVLNFTPVCHSSFTYFHDSLPGHTNQYYFNSTSVSGNSQPVSFSWSLNGQTITNYFSLSAVLSPGTNTVCLAIAGPGCADTSCQTIIVTPPSSCNLQPSFSYTASANNSRQIAFAASPVISGYSYHWNFGDGFTGSQPNTIHTYATSGNYQVKLKVFNTNSNCSDSVAQTIQVQAPPSAQCNAAFSTASNGSLVSFQAASTTNNFIHSWFFGDGGQGAGAQTSHNYLQPGTYSVKHIIRDSLNTCKDSVTSVITLNFTPVCNTNFIIVQDSFQYNLYRFYAQNTSSNGSGAVYSWKLDNNVIGNGSFIATNIQPGQHTVCLTVTNSGCTNTSCQTLNVVAPPGCNFQAAFSYSASSVNPRQISFAATPSQSGFVYNWNFGDGLLGLGNTPVHTYNTAGNYMVKLVVFQNTTQCRDTVMQMIHVSGSAADSCTASFSYTQVQNLTNKIAFTAISNQSITSQSWTITPLWDSTAVITILQTNNPVHSFGTTGLYMVCLSVTTSTGCHRYYCDTLNITSIDGRMASSIPSYPNPAGNNVSLQLSMQQPSQMMIRVFNSYGTEVYSLQRTGNTGNNTITIPVQSFSPGQYYIDIEFAGQRKKSIFLKL